MLEQTTRHWWTLALRGALAVLFGLIALFQPGATVLALATIFGAYLLFDGIFALVAAFRLSHADARWWPLVWEGVFGIGFGLYALIHPVTAAVTLVYVLALWAVITGVTGIVAAIQLRRVIANEFFLLIAGIVSLLLGIILFAAPGAALVAWSWIIGIYALVFGGLLIALSLRLRRQPSLTLPLNNPLA